MRCCHLCGAPSLGSDRYIRCANHRETISTGQPICTKGICRDCFDEFRWDWHAAVSEHAWTCTHCREVCPRCTLPRAFTLGGGLRTHERKAHFWAMLNVISHAEADRRLLSGQENRGAGTSDEVIDHWPDMPSERLVEDLNRTSLATSLAERLACWGNPLISGDAWGHEGGAGALLTVRTGSGGRIEAYHVLGLVGGRCPSAAPSKGGGGTEVIHSCLVQVFNPARRRWVRVQQIGTAPTKLLAHTAVAFGSRLFIFGGGDGKRMSAELFTLDVRMMDAAEDDHSSPISAMPISSIGTCRAVGAPMR